MPRAATLRPVDVDPQLLDRARRGRRAATIELLATFYPPVYRTAAALTGRQDAARAVSRKVMIDGLNRLPAFDDVGEPDRWFRHHAVLSARAASGQPVSTKKDALMTPDAAMPYLAFVVALRDLPVQQAEAYLLHHGEGLSGRALGIVMDYSQVAAQKHLEAAERTMRAIGGENVGALTAQLVRAYRSLTPGEKIILPAVTAAVRRRRRKQLLRWVGWLVFLVGLAFAAWGGWVIWRAIQA